MADGELFELADESFYEALYRYKPLPTYSAPLRTLIPESWKLINSDIWLHAVAAPSKTTQGYKIHLSIIPQQALKLIGIVVPICVENAVSFKIPADDRLHALLNSKSANRGFSGKFLTIYPDTGQQFKVLIKLLYQRLKGEDLHGPHILSDQRYKDCPILYWRYGGFNSPSRLNPDGTTTPLITTPDGGYAEDNRTPFFQLPKWVSNPFPQLHAEKSTDSTVLKGRYEVRGHLSFSNSGGVYTAFDTEQGHDVVIKEARPHVNTWNIDLRSWDAVSLLKREHRILSILEPLSFVPSAIDLFQEWEHWFHVQTNCPGVLLSQFWAKQDLVLVPHIRRRSTLTTFLNLFGNIAFQLIEMVQQIHERGILIGDVSPHNIIVDEKTHTTYIIDFESSSIAQEDDDAFQKYSVQWGTPGFKHPGRTTRQRLLPVDDFYGLAMTLYFSIIPINSLFRLKCDARALFLRKLTSLGVPDECASVIASLEVGRSDEAKRLARDIMKRRVTFACANINEECTRTAQQDLISDAEIEHIITGIGTFIRNKTECNRSDRLWPGHFAVFTTNPLNIAFGACGIALFLHDAIGEVPAEAVAWIRESPLSNESYPPSLFLGSAGVAYALLEIGMYNKAEDVMAMTFRSPLKFAEKNMFVGAAGWGFASLHFYMTTRKQVYLDEAIVAAEHLLATAEYVDMKCFWRCNEDGRVHYGYGYGSAGIGLFLLNVAVITQEEKFLRAAIAAIEFDISKKESTRAGAQWKRFEGDSLYYPFWIQGSAGICSVLFRFGRLLRDTRYSQLAQTWSNEIFIKFAFSQGLLEGLAGIGECMMDAYYFSGDDDFRYKARDIADTLSWFAVNRMDGIAFPGRWLSRISTDYGTGSAGIGLFLSRLLRPGNRHFLDLYNGPSGSSGHVNLALEGRFGANTYKKR